MKKNKMMRTASVLLIAVLLSTCAISGTFAKYATKVEGTASASVAKWDVAASVGTATNVFDLFKTIKDSNGTDNETDVASGKIAPGTSGEFTITLDANNEVSTAYSVTFELTKSNPNLPILFSVDGGEFKSTLDSVNGTITLSSDAATLDRDIIVKWQWAIGDETGSDNVFGDGSTSVTVKAIVNFTQVD